MKLGAPSAQKNPHPHAVVNGAEVTAYPDGVVGLHWQEHGFGKLFSPRDACALGRALLAMAREATAPARPARSPKNTKKSRPTRSPEEM